MKLLASVAAPAKFVDEELERNGGDGAGVAEVAGGGSCHTSIIVSRFHPRDIVREGGTSGGGVHLSFEGLEVVIDEGDELLFVPPGKWTLGAKEAVEDISLGPQFLLQIVCPRHCLQVHPCRPGNLIAHGIPPV